MKIHLSRRTKLDVDKLEEGKTYMITFPSNTPADMALSTSKRLNQYIKENNRDIIFIFNIVGGVKVDEIQ